MKLNSDESQRFLDTALRQRFADFYQTLGLNQDDEPNNDTLLVGSGLLDSLGLLQLAMWIQKEIGQPIDPEAFDLREEWQTVGTVLTFIHKHRRADS